VRKITVLLVLALLFPILLHAECRTYINLGANYSTFRTQEGESKPGLSVGIGRRYYAPYNSKSFLGGELSFNEEKILVENITWPMGEYRHFSGVITGDYDIDLNYFDISLYLGYRLKILKSSDLEFSVGPSLSIPVDNNTKRTVTKEEFFEQEISDYDYDYYHYDADPGPTLIPFMERGMDPNAGINMKITLCWNYLHFTLDHFRALTTTKKIIGLTLFDKIDWMSLLIGISF